jgi:hypothetical protein
MAGAVSLASPREEISSVEMNGRVIPVTGAENAADRKEDRAANFAKSIGSTIPRPPNLTGNVARSHAAFSRGTPHMSDHVYFSSVDTDPART